VCRVKPRGSGSPTRCGAETGDADGGALSLPVTLMALATAWRANQENTHPLLHHGAAPLLGFVAGEMDGRDPHPRVPERRPGAPAWSPDWSRIGHRIRGMRCHAVGQLRAMSSRFPWSDVVSWDGALWAETRYVLLESVLGFTALGGSNPPPSATWQEHRLTNENASGDVSGGVLRGGFGPARSRLDDRLRRGHRRPPRCAARWRSRPPGRRDPPGRGERRVVAPADVPSAARPGGRASSSPGARRERQAGVRRHRRDRRRNGGRA
jgi:hypothetical protein